jgi:hypothetical protein
MGTSDSVSDQENARLVRISPVLWGSRLVKNSLFEGCFRINSGWMWEGLFATIPFIVG